MADSGSRVEIGYLEKGEDHRLESKFFPSKVGGKPAWLDLKNISVDVSCGICSDPCIFLCQLYAPVSEERAYHRMVYVFVCRKPECCLENDHKNFKVFRCQLPRVNDYYAAEEPNNEPSWCAEGVVDRYTPTCFVCGCPSSFRCFECEFVKYCCKQHQILHWESGHSESCGTDGEKPTSLTLLFPEYEIITEPEIDDDEEESGKKQEKSEDDKLKEYQQLQREGKAGTLQNVPLEILEHLDLVKEDKYLKIFKSRLNLCPDQVFRYDKGGKPLWVAKPNLSDEDVPACEFCGKPRQFEFQILPTLLSYLNVDSLNKSIDWGTLLVYTCKDSCGEGPAYKKEFLWKQDIL